MTQNEFYEKRAEAIRLLTEAKDIMDELSMEKMTPVLNLEKQLMKRSDTIEFISLLDDYRNAVRKHDDIVNLSIKIVELRAKINLIY